MAGVSRSRISLAADEVILSSHVATQELLIELLGVSVRTACGMGEQQCRQDSLLVWPSFDHLFCFLIAFIAGLSDVLYALPESCSIVSNEICGLQRLSALM